VPDDVDLKALNRSLKKVGGENLSGFIWLRTGSNGGICWTWYWSLILSLHSNWTFSWISERLLQRPLLRGDD
jgi:hypothetical protein